MTTPPGLTDADRADLHERLASWFGGDDRQAFLVSHLAPLVDRIKADGYIAGLADGVGARASEFQQAALEMARKAALAERRAEEAEYHVEQLRDARDRAERRIERVEALANGGDTRTLDDIDGPAVMIDDLRAALEDVGGAGTGDSAERIGERAVELATERDAALCRIARAERLIDSWEHDAPEHSNPVFIGRLRECLRRDPAPVRLRGNEKEPLSCNAEGIPHSAHDWDFGSGEMFRCAGTPGCDDECTGLCGEHHWLDRPESDTRECLTCGTEVAG